MILVNECDSETVQNDESPVGLLSLSHFIEKHRAAQIKRLARKRFTKWKMRCMTPGKISRMEKRTVIIN